MGERDKSFAGGIPRNSRGNYNRMAAGVQREQEEEARKQEAAERALAAAQQAAAEQREAAEEQAAAARHASAAQQAAAAQQQAAASLQQAATVLQQAAVEQAAPERESREDRSFYQRFNKWRADIFVTRHASNKDWIFRVDFAVMQRMYVTSLRRELAVLARKCQQPNHASILAAGTLLSAYCDALEKYKQMIEGQKEGEDDPFVLSSDVAMDREIMDNAGFFDGEAEKHLERHDVEEQLYGGPRPIFNKAARARRLTWRFVAAVVGALSLLVPMLIMVLWDNILVRLLTVCICVMLFAFVLVYALHESHSATDGWTATVAYAAVLVVFVGSIS